MDSGKKGGLGVFLQAASNYRVWILAVAYGASFGLELFIHGYAAVYFVDRYKLDLETAGLAVGAFGLLALFARALGGIASDKVAARFGLQGRGILLTLLMAGEGLGLLGFYMMGDVGPAIAMLLVFGLFTHMSCGGIYALSPFIDRKALGGVSGIIGAGGNVGGVAAGFLLKATGSLPPGAVHPGLGGARHRDLCPRRAVLASEGRGGEGAIRRGGGEAVCDRRRRRHDGRRLTITARRPCAGPSQGGPAQALSPTPQAWQA